MDTNEYAARRIATLLRQIAKLTPNALKVEGVGGFLELQDFDRLAQGIERNLPAFEPVTEEQKQTIWENTLEMVSEDPKDTARDIFDNMTDYEMRMEVDYMMEEEEEEEEDED